MRSIRLTNSEWVLDETLMLGSKGGFGAVYAGTSPSGTQVAIKVLRDQDDHPRELEFARAYCGIQSKHVVPILDFGIDAGMNLPCIVMTRAEFSLRQKLLEVGRFPEVDAVAILVDLARGLIEASSWVHRDMKPENSLYADQRWQIADFGIARHADSATATHTMRFAMSRPYAAPEQIEGRHATQATDVYALGCIGAELLSGRFLFAGPDFERQHLQTHPAIEGASPRLQALLLRMLSKPEETRPTIKEVLAELQEIRTPRIPQGTGAARLSSAVARVADGIAQEEAQRLSEHARLVLRQQTSDAGSPALASIGEKLFSTIGDAAHGSRHNVVQALTVQLPQPTIVQQLSHVSFLATLGQGHIALTNGLWRNIGRHEFSESGWDVFCGDAMAVWQDAYVRSAALWYASVGGDKPAWYETAYFPSQGGVHAPTFLPYNQAAATHAQKKGGWGFAYRPRKLEGDALENFVNRWITWFAEACEGSLVRPDKLPEEF